MNRERFIRQRRSDWKQLELLLERLRSTRMARWHSQDVADLSRLYRSVCYDLSLVRSREWGARLEQYLNDLVAQGHNCLYRSPPQSLAGVVDFLSTGFPWLLRRRGGSFLLALALFAGPFLVSLAVGAIRPDLAELVAGPEALQGAEQNFGDDFNTAFDAEFAGQRTAMAGFYVRNNVGIAFQAFALGAFCGLGTAVVLLSNGITIGMVAGYILSVGGSTAQNFYSFVISHGAFELTAIVVAGAAGLVLGQGVLFPGNRTRLESLQHHGRQSLLLALGAGAMLVIAAMIEAFFSPLPIDPRIKYVVGTLLWILVGLYLSLAGRSSTDTVSDDEERADG